MRVWRCWCRPGRGPVASRLELAGGELVVGVVGQQLGGPAVLTLVAGVQEAPEAVVQARRTDLVARLGTRHLLFHVSIIGTAGDFVEADM